MARPSTPNVSQFYNSQPRGITSYAGMADGDKRILGCMQKPITNSQGQKKQHLEARCVHKRAIFPLSSKPAVPLPLFPTSVTMPSAAHTTLVNPEAVFQVENLTFVSSPSPCPASPLQPRAVSIPEPKQSHAIRTSQAVLIPADMCPFPGSHALYALWKRPLHPLTDSKCHLRCNFAQWQQLPCCIPASTFLSPPRCSPRPETHGRDFQRRAFCFQAAVLP